MNCQINSINFKFKVKGIVEKFDTCRTTKVYLEMCHGSTIFTQVVTHLILRKVEAKHITFGCEAKCSPLKEHVDPEYHWSERGKTHDSRLTTALLYIFFVMPWPLPFMNGCGSSINNLFIMYHFLYLLWLKLSLAMGVCKYDLSHFWVWSW